MRRGLDGAGLLPGEPVEVLEREVDAPARNVLAESLQAVVAQQLLPKVGGGRVAAVEIVFANAAVSNLIRRGKIQQITSIVQGGAKQGMIDMDTAIRALYEQGLVTARDAYDKAIDKELFKDILDEVVTTNV